MYIVRRIVGNWTSKHIELLKPFGIELKNPGYDILAIKEDENYFQTFDIIKDAKDFKVTGGMIHFNETELKSSNQYLLHNFGLAIEYASRISKDDEGFRYLRYAFGEICPEFGTPIQEQIRPITLAKEPKLSSNTINLT